MNNNPIPIDSNMMGMNNQMMFPQQQDPIYSMNMHNMGIGLQ